jgi:G-protein coupled receptor 98
VDDPVPEPNEIFQLSLTNVAGGARVDTSQNTASINVLKSDSSNGVFGFTSGSLTSTIAEPGNVSLAVNRSGGEFGDVTVTWEVREASNGLVATGDFSPATGTVEFQENNNLQMFAVTTLDEMVPELNEDFIVVLTSAIANDNETSSTPTSGASINNELSQVTLTVTENDFPYGVLQFSSSAPAAGQQIILATEMPELITTEASGMVTVYVVRAQGLVGNVNIEFFTSDGTATNLGVDPDYVSNAGILSFAPGTTMQSFDVVLIDDLDPELAKTFYVNLTNPQGG